MLNSILNDFWFKPIDTCEITGNDETDKMISYIKEFQNGDFQRKEEFVDFFLNASDDNILVIGMRLFMAIASHEDFELLEEFLSESEEDELYVFLAFVEEALSLQVLPYLLALYETWEDTEVGDDIAMHICNMLGVTYHEEENYDVEQLGRLFIEFANNHDLNQYYYDGEPFYTGEMTKKIIQIAMECRQREGEFYTDELSSIISNTCGKECPVAYGIVVSDSKIKEILDYVSDVSKFECGKGEKYFYGNKVGKEQQYNGKQGI